MSDPKESGRDPLTGSIPRSESSKGALGLLRAGMNRTFHAVIRNLPMPATTRAALHRLRGVKVGQNVFIGAEVFIDDAEPASVVIEDDVVILIRSTLLGHAYYPQRFQKYLGESSGRHGITIRRGAYLGANVTVLPGVEIGEHSMVAAGAVVTRDVPPRTLVAGVPARVIRELP